MFAQMEKAAPAVCESLVMLGWSHRSEPLAQGGATLLPRGPYGLKGNQAEDVGLFCYFQPLLFWQVFENRALQGKGSFTM